MILGSGDGDYAALAELLQKVGVSVTVIAVAQCCSKRLRNLADSFIKAPVATSSRYLPAISGPMVRSAWLHAHT